jgi:hypothetical protein
MNMGDLSFNKVLSQLPNPTTPNSVYYVRVGTGFDVYVTGNDNIPIKINNAGLTISDVESIVGSRSGGNIIFNGYGSLAKTNYNFSGFSVSNRPLPPGIIHGFSNRITNAVVPCDQVIPVNKDYLYTFSFNIVGEFSDPRAETITNGNNFYLGVDALDISGNSIQPQNITMTRYNANFNISEGSTIKSISFTDKSEYDRFKTDAMTVVAGGKYLVDPTYTDANGTSYNQYTRWVLTRLISNASWVFDDAKMTVTTSSSVWLLNSQVDPTYLAKTGGISTTIGLSHTGGTYLYPDPDTSNVPVKSTWTKYNITIDPKSLRDGTAAIRLIFLINRTNYGTINTTIAGLDLNYRISPELHYKSYELASNVIPPGLINPVITLSHNASNSTVKYTIKADGISSPAGTTTSATSRMDSRYYNNLSVSLPGGWIGINSSNGLLTLMSYFSHNTPFSVSYETNSTNYWIAPISWKRIK